MQEEGAASTAGIGALVAGSLFLAVFATTVHTLPEPEPLDHPMAAPLLDRLLASADPPPLLGGPGRSVDAAAVDRLRNASWQPGHATGLPYEEARGRLGLDAAGLEFHLRIRPLLAPPLADGVRTAYVAASEPVPTLTVEAEETMQLLEEATQAVEGLLSPAAAVERRLLAGLPVAFTDRIHLHGLPLHSPDDEAVPLEDDADGDVYPADHLRDTLVPRLAEYHIVVAGSGTATEALLDACAGLRAWLHAGGHLILLPPAGPARDLLDCLFATGGAEANGPRAAEEPLHPALQLPHPVDPDAPTGPPWPAHRGLHAILPGPQGLDLATHRDGVLGQGSLLATAFSPALHAHALGENEASQLLENLLWGTLAAPHRLDYGRPTAGDAAAAVRHGVLDGVPVRIELHVWPQHR